MGIQQVIRADDSGQGWCILRTAGPRTMALTKSLADAGFGAWTPIYEITRRRGRSRDRHYVEAPIIPTFVFVPEQHLRALAAMLAQPTHPHPAFSIFVYAGRAPIIAERSMAHLRKAEEQARLRAEQRARTDKAKQRIDIPVGEKVKVVEESNFLGLTGVVESCDGRTAMVNFGGPYAIEIQTWRLMTDELLIAA